MQALADLLNPENWVIYSSYGVQYTQIGFKQACNRPSNTIYSYKNFLKPPKELPPTPFENNLSIM